MDIRCQIWFFKLDFSKIMYRSTGGNNDLESKIYQGKPWCPTNLKIMISKKVSLFEKSCHFYASWAWFKFCVCFFSYQALTFSQSYWTFSHEKNWLKNMTRAKTWAIYKTSIPGKINQKTTLQNCQMSCLSCITLKLFTNIADAPNGLVIIISVWLMTQNLSACDMKNTKIWTLLEDYFENFLF